MGTIFANRAHAGALGLAGTRKKRLWSFFNVFFFSQFCVKRFGHGLFPKKRMAFFYSSFEETPKNAIKDV
jgi:hypothetical protein